jgi:hypothetical protein
MKYVIAAFTLLLVAPFQARALGPSFSYEGRAFDASGNPLTAASVTFRISIRPPGYDTCAMYSEYQMVDLSASNGFFTLAVNGVNSQSQTYSSVSPAFEKVFSNAAPFSFSAGDCGTAMTYTPTPSDGRNLKVELSTDGTTYEALPLIAIGSVPYAISAQQIAGYGPSQLLRVGAGVSGTTELTQAMLTELNALLAGTSTQYATPSSLIPAISSVISGTTMFSPPAGNLTLNPASGGIVLSPAATQNVTISSSVASSNPTTGALVVSGGLGVSGSINTGGNIISTGTISGSVIQGSNVVVPVSSAMSPSLQIGNGGNGVFAPNNNILAFTTNATERMRIETNGNVGIGTTSPSAPLNVYGTSGSPVKIQSPSAPKISFNDTSGALVGGIGSDSANPLILYGASGYSNFAVSNMGNVGIGTTAPASAVDAIGYDANVTLSVQNASSTMPRFPSVSVRNYMDMAGSGYPRVVLTNSGGTNLAPSALPGALEVGGFETFGSYDSTANTARGAAIKVMTESPWTSGNTPSSLNIMTGSTGTLSARLTVMSNGNVGIGTVTPGSKLDVKGAIRYLGTTSGYVGFQAPAAAGATIYTLPSADGTSGQVLGTDGAGNLSWVTQSAAPTSGVCTTSSSSIVLSTTETSWSCTGIAVGDVVSCSPLVAQPAGVTWSARAYGPGQAGLVGSANGTSTAFVCMWMRP